VTTVRGTLPLESQLCFAVYSANIAINRMYRPVLDRLGITYPQYLIMSALWEMDGQTIGAIADRLSLESSTVTPAVKRLEVADFLTRQRNPDDERKVVVTLAPKGKMLQEDAKCLTDTLLQKSGLPVASIIRLNEEIRRLRDALVSNTSAE
jgi:MarR family transcriptional regulator, organic hydroperoxide resistance regulator